MTTEARRDGTDGYGLTDCALYKVPTRKELARILLTTRRHLNELSRRDDLYYRFSRKKEDGRLRWIDAPRDDLKKVQRRIADLLGRVAAPPFLFGCVRGRSFLDNAMAHRGAKAFHLLDLADYFPSCTANKVAWFFGTVMRCPPDVVAILVRITTLNGCLPQGSPASPILSYYAYMDMWSEIDAIARDAGLTHSGYIDDITLSGDLVRGRTVFAIKRCIARHGHTVKEEKEGSTFLGVPIVTGIALSGNELRLRNKQHAKIHRLRREVEVEENEDDRLKKQRSLEGLERHARYVSDANAPVS